MKVSDFGYSLPKELIAQEPLPRRDDSRMMVLLRGQRRIIHSRFSELGEYLKAGDCFVLNDTKVIPARLHGRRTKTGGRVEVLLLEPAATDGARNSQSDSSADGRRLTHMNEEILRCAQNDTERPGLSDSQTLRLSDGPLWLALTNSRSSIEEGETIEMADGALQARVEAITDDGTRLVRFTCGQGDFARMLEAWGEPPLPPYIRRAPNPGDAERYQTVYARREGAVAAPTAGLHFTPRMLETLREKGVGLATLTLHVGLGTFRPVKVENVEDHHIHSEPFELPAECAEAITNARREGKRVVAVGTTVVRVLEACADEEGHLTPRMGRTDLFIYPEYRFKAVDALLTNFHLPHSTLLMLVCAFGGTAFVLEGYQQAVAAKYRFFSYGDCMLLLP